MVKLFNYFSNSVHTIEELRHYVFVLNQGNGNQRHSKVLVSLSNLTYVAKFLLEFLGLAALHSFSSKLQK